MPRTEEARRDREAADLQHMDVHVQADEPNDEVAPFTELGHTDFETLASAAPRYDEAVAKLADRDAGLKSFSLDDAMDPAIFGVSSSFAAAEPPAPTNRMVNSTWRILEEQRVNAMEIVADCEAEIAKWTTKRDDAMRAADMCLAGQNGGE